MSTILDKIIAHKRKEVLDRKNSVPVASLEKQPYFNRASYSLSESLLKPGLSGIIAEFKRRSPSKGDINPEADLVKVTSGYAKAGASGLSILTDENFFGGKDQYIEQARPHTSIPILRKEFIIDEYQVIEAKSIGADVILLIAECLTKTEVQHLAKMAKSLGLEVLMEIHSEDQLEKCNEYLDIIGVNNRNLKDFSVSIDTSVQLFAKIPNEFVKISESGISKPETIVYLKKVGFQGFLIGEYFMTAKEPERKFETFVKEIQQSIKKT